MIALLLLVLAGCSGSRNQVVQAVRTATTTPLGTPVPSEGLPTRTPARTPARTPVSPTRVTRTPTPSRTPVPPPTVAPTVTTPAGFVWSAIAGYQDIGAPLPLCARGFGGGIFVPDDAFTDIQTATFGDALWLGAGAYFPNPCSGDEPVGDPDGSRVQSVRFEITDGQGSRYDHTERNVPYCLFGDDGSRCTPYSFPDNGCFWPESDAGSGFPLTSGYHDLLVTISSVDGASEQWFASLFIVPPPGSPCE